MDASTCTFVDGFPTTCPPGDRGPLHDAVTWPLAFLSTVFVGLRIYCKIWRHGKLSLDDWFLIGAWVCSTESSLQMI